MTTINISSEAYKRVLKRKQKLESAEQRLISMSEAVDSLLGVSGNNENV